MTAQPYKQFKLTLVPHGGQRVRGATIECGHCGVIANCPFNSFKNGGSEREEVFIGSRFKAMGWKVGNTASQHRCPGCFAKIRQAAKRNRDAGDSNVVQLVAPASEPVREMTREDRRIIFQKLNEIYDDGGYSANWTDALVAKDLGIPRAWVKTIRDENFGPEGSNEQINATIEQATELLASFKQYAKEAEPVWKMFCDLSEKAERIEKRIAEIQKDLR